MKQIYLYKTLLLPAQIKDVDGKKGIVTGVLSKFNVVDSYGDIVRKGAFTKSIIETGPKSSQPRIKYLLNHNTSQPLGVFTDLSEDASGLNYEAQVGSHNLGVDFVKMVESGLITEHSFGYETMKRNQLQDYSDYMKSPNLGWYELTELRMWEGSPLTAWGACSQTPLTGMKGKEKEDAIQAIVNRQKNMEKFCRNTTATDETIELLLIENKQLTQLIIDSTQPAKETTVPVIAISDWSDAINSFTKSLK